MFGMLGGASQYIEEMERAGQAQVVASAVLPIEGPWTDLESLGFVPGTQVDDLFRQVDLPAGWTKQGSNHAMWSYVVDERGIRRVGVFYKAAYYDRKAHLNLLSVGYEFATEAMYGDGDPALPGEWSALTTAERDDFSTAVRDYLARCDEYPEIYGDRRPRVEIFLTLIDAQARP
jgi:hypothetical protein